MNQQFLFRLDSQQQEQKRAVVPNTKTRTLESQRQVADSVSSYSSMFQRTSQLQQNEYEVENISSLHTKLHQEADKIRKWKMQAELDLKDKDKKLTAASSQIETMKKSLLELQLENEKMSSRMQEEIENRDEIIQKITTTRDMCALLKSTATTLEERMLHCETEKTELKYAGRENSQHLEELSNKFENLHLSFENSHKKIIMQAEKNRNQCLEKESLLTSKCEKNLVQIQSLSTEIKDKNEMISELQDSLKEKCKAVEKLHEEVGTLEEKNKILAESVETKEEDFKESAMRILNIQEEKHELEVRIEKYQLDSDKLQESKDKLCKEMTAVSTKYEKDLLEAHDKIQDLEKRIDNEQKRLQDCQDRLEESMSCAENLKSSKDILTLETTDLEMKLDLQNFEISNLGSALKEKIEEISKQNGEIEVLTAKLNKENECTIQLQDAKKDLHSKICSLQFEKGELQQTVQNLEEILTNKKNEVQTILSKESSQTESLKASIKLKEDNLEKERKQVMNLKEISDQLQAEIVKKDSTLLLQTEEKEKLEQELQNTRSLIEQHEKELNEANCYVDQLKAKYEEEKSKAEDLIDQLKDVNIEKKEHGKSLNSQQKKLAAQAKQNKELEKEIKTLKADLNKEMKKNAEKEKTVDSMKEELEYLKETNKEIIESKVEFEKEMMVLKQECIQEKKSSEQAIAKAKELQESAKKEKEKAKALTKCQLTEMMGTLDDYKQNSEKMLAEKEAETKSLKNKLETLHRESSSEKEKLKDENQQLSSKLKIMAQEKEGLNGKLKDSSGENLSLIEKIQELEKQLKCRESLCSKVMNTSPTFPSSSQLSQHAPPVAPVTPQKQVACTPKLPRTPLQTNILRTPQRSILRASGSLSKRRKVAFMSKDYDMPSSSDELMELDVEMQGKNQGAMFLTPSGGMRAPKLSMLEAKSKSPYERTPVQPIIGKPVHASTPVLKNSDVLGMTRLTSITEKPKVAESKIKKPDSLKTPNIRNVTSKKSSQFFTTSPKDRAAKTRIKEKAKKDKTEQLSWFDIDSVYGFNPED